MKPSIWNLTLAAAAGLLCFAPLPSRAQNLYITSEFYNAVGEYDATTGATINASFITGLFNPQYLVFSSNNLYVTNLLNPRFWTVGKYSAISGAAINSSLITGLNPLQGLAVSGDNLYVSGSNTVGEYNAITGVAINASLFGLHLPEALAISGSNLYVLYLSGTGIGNGTRPGSYVGVYNAITGAVINPSLISGLVEPKGLAISGSNLYVGSAFYYTVGEYNAATGTPINPSLIKGSNPPQGLAISGKRLYVLYLSGTAAGSYVSKYDAATGAAIDESLVTGLVQPGAIAVSSPPPVLSGSSIATGTNGVDFRYRILGSNDPTSFNATGLPKGLSVNTSTGLISGKPALSGTFEVRISATNAAGTGSAFLTLVVITPPVPVISSALNVTGTSAQPFRYQIAASNNPTSFNASGLPNGLSVNTSTGLISGKPAVSGTFSVGISAANAGGTDSVTLTLAILPPLPAISSDLTALTTNGLAFNYQITASNSPVSFNATGLPKGLTVNTSAGLISGSAAVNGKYPVTISAANAGGTGSATLVITVNFSAVRGTYAGLAAIGGTNTGLITLTLTPAGGFTGQFKLGSMRRSLTGTFSSSGTFKGTLNAGATTLNLALTIDPVFKGISGTITAATAGGITGYSVESLRLGKLMSGTLTPGLAGRYTAIIPAVSGTDPALPHAPGFGTMTVSTRGAVHVAGKLGDGTAFTLGGQLQADGRTCTLCTPLYGNSNPGSIAGNITFQPSADSDSDGVFDWIKPAQRGGAYYPGGFSLSVDLLTAKYAAPPLITGTAIFTVGGGSLFASAISDSLLISSRGMVTVTGINQGGVTVTLTPANGTFGGTFLYPGTGTTTSFSGVIYQKPLPAGYGLFLGAGQSGSLEITQ